MIVEGRKDDIFSWNKGWKVAINFLGRKESNEEEEGESSFLGISKEKEDESRFLGNSKDEEDESIFLRNYEEEEGEISFSGIPEEEEGGKGSDLMTIKKDLDLDFLFKIDLILISFSL